MELVTDHGIYSTIRIKTFNLKYWTVITQLFYLKKKLFIWFEGENVFLIIMNVNMTISPLRSYVLLGFESPKMLGFCRLDRSPLLDLVVEVTPRLLMGEIWHSFVLQLQHAMGSVARVFYYVQGMPPMIPLPRLLLAYCHRPQKNGSLCLLKSQFRGALW